MWYGLKVDPVNHFKPISKGEYIHFKFQSLVERISSDCAQGIWTGNDKFAIQLALYLCIKTIRNSRSHSHSHSQSKYVFTILFSCLFAVRQFGMRVLHMFRQTERYDHIYRIYCVFYCCVCLCVCVCVSVRTQTRSYVCITLVTVAYFVGHKIEKPPK